MKQIILENKTITLIKTAHISQHSIEQVQQAIDEIKPDTICVELDQRRYENITNPKDFSQTKLIDIIKQKKVALFAINLLLANYQKKLAGFTNNQVGGEMKKGIELANITKANLVLMDRDIQVTFKRIWRFLSFFEKVKLLNLLFASLFDKGESISEEELEDLKHQDQLTAALSEISTAFPTVSRILVEERDSYMAMKIKHAPGNNVVVIVGAAHSIGIEQKLSQEIPIETLDEVPQPSFVSKLLKWLFPIGIAVLIVISIGLNLNGLWHLGKWMLAVSIASAIGALLCLAHPLTILVSFLAAPISTLSPVLSVGWFAGMSEASLRAPIVDDFQTMSEDTKSIKKALKNNVLRTLLVMLVTSLFSSVVTLLFSVEAIRNLFF